MNKVLLTGIALVVAVACGDDDEKPAPYEPGPGEAGAPPGTGGRPDSGTGGAAGAPAPSEGGAPEVPTEGGAAGADDVEAQITYGKYLVDHLIACPDCHTPRTEQGAPDFENYMAGVECFVRLETGDCLNSPNLTNHETGLKNRTDDEIRLMITDGLRPGATDYEPLHPVMPYYVFHNMENAELDAIIAYLRTIPAVEHAVPRSDEAFEVAAPANPLDPFLIPMPAEDYPEYESAVRGRYLSTHVGLCIECHTPHEMGPDVLDPEKYFSGGEPFAIGLPVVPTSKNLTSDPATGLGDWEVEDIVKALKEGVDKNGDGICPPMPVGPMAAYGGLTDEDARDIANYLKSLPAIENEIEDQCTWPPM